MKTGLTALESQRLSFEADTRLGPDEIVAPIGMGGMGEVYRARDTRLDRSVAIKVLSGALAADSESRRRFEEEARAIAVLNDPHIFTFHESAAMTTSTISSSSFRRARRLPINSTCFGAKIGEC